MSDKIKGFTVTFDRDVSQEYADIVMNSVRIISHVQDVTLSVRSADDHMNRMRVTREIKKKLYELIDELD